MEPQEQEGTFREIAAGIRYVAKVPWLWVTIVLFSVILLGPIILSRFGLPGLIGLILGGFAIGAHGLDLIHAGNQTVPELGQLGLLYLMFIAGLELNGVKPEMIPTEVGF